MTADTTPSLDILRPIIGIENRSAQEVFDIMCDRFRKAASYITELEGERKEARDIVALCNNSLFGSWGYFTAVQPSGKTAASAIEDLKRDAREAYARAEAAEANARRLETGIAEIMAGCVSGEVGGEDVVWFSTIETLWERCAHLIAPNSTAEIPQTTVVADILAALTTKEADRGDPTTA